MNRKYSGFTLVEMLIVMGIIIILMAVGIAAGRFAINRANDVAHQNAADQLFIAAQSYLTDEREYPMLPAVGWDGIGGALADGGLLSEYLTIGEFSGGTDATILYWTSDARDSALVCVSLGGQGDADSRGHYCTGNGFSSESTGPGSITAKETEITTVFPTTGWCAVSPWDNDGKVFGSELVEAPTSTTCAQTYVCTSCAAGGGTEE